jgi:hypothetical protein
LLDLSLGQATSLIDYLHTNPQFKIPKNKFDYVQNALNITSTMSLAKQLPWLQAFLLRMGFKGRIESAMPWIDKKINAKGALIKVGNDLINHAVIETMVGAWLKDFEVESYKILHKDAVEKGKAMSPALRKQKQVYINGKKIFDKEIKDNLWTLEPERYKGLQEHVKNHPEDKVAVKRLKKAEKFYNGVYDKKGNLRIDTVESQIARLEYKLVKKIMNSIKTALKSNMNDAQYEAFIKKNPINEIVKHFYIPRKATEEFLKYYDPNSLNLDKQIKDGTRYHAQKLAEEKYGTSKLTPKQIDEFMEKGEVLALKDIMAITTHANNLFNPKHLLRRKFYMGERIFIPKENKWVDVYESRYDYYMPSYIGASSKLVANLNAFPYLVNIPGLKVAKGIPKILVELSRQKDNVIAAYVHDMIAGRTGLMTPQTGDILVDFGRWVGHGNKYISRVNLSGLRSPVKNFRLALSQNSLEYDIPSALMNASRALSFKNRIEASKTGYMGLSLSGLTEADNRLLNRVFDKLFATMRFPSSEQMGRLSSIYLSLMELPKFIDNLRLPKDNPKRKEAENRARSFYLLTEDPIVITDTPTRKITIKGGQIELLKRFGLGTAEVDWTGSENVGVKGIDVKRFNKAGELIKTEEDVFKLTPFERDKLQQQIDIVQSKMLTMSHTQTQGSTLEIFQPHFLMERTGIVKGGMLYAQLALQATYNQFRGMKDAVKFNNYHRIAGFIATALAASQIEEYAINDLLLGKPNPGKLDRSLRNKLFRSLQEADIGGLLGFTWGLLNQEIPYGNPLYPNAFLNQGTTVIQAIVDIARAGGEKLGVDPAGKGDFAKYYVRSKRYGQAPKDLLKGIVATYRDYQSLYLNTNHPYAVAQRDLDKLEDKFYKETPNVKPEIISHSVMTGHYNELKKAFEQTGGLFQKFYKMEDEDWEYFNGIVMNAWVAKRNEFIQGTKTPPGASMAATSAIEDKLMSLHPILNGLGSKPSKKGKTQTAWMSKREEYKSYCQRLALDQGKDKNFYWKQLLDQEQKYYLKMNSFLKQWRGWINKHENYKFDENKKYWQKMYPTYWDKKLMGVPTEESLKQFEGKFKGIELDSAKIMSQERISNLLKELK